MGKKEKIILIIDKDCFLNQFLNNIVLLENDI
jgi:hypothetical protein